MAPSLLKIKINALNRLSKDVSLYKLELEEQKQVIDKLEKSPDQDEELQYEIKKQTQVLNETQNLIPTLQQKYKDFVEDLKEYISGNESSLNEDELTEAQVVLANSDKI